MRRLVPWTMLLTCACGATTEPESAQPVGGSGGTSASPVGGSGSNAGSSGAAGSNAATAGSGGDCSRAEPAQHRPMEVVCDRVRPAGNALPGEAPSGGPCASDADCTVGENGRCAESRAGYQCTYDECFADAECGAGGPCGCERAFWSDANSCLEGNCSTDADCGSPGFCSPTFSDCGDYSGVVGYYCHTCEDECLDDGDCIDAERGGGYCMYSPEVAHWVCGYGQCVG